MPEWGTIRVTGGREIVVTPLTGVQPGELHPWLAGSAWAALCYQRGLLLIHASAVAFGNGAIAFCGPTGCGKSTLAAHIHSLGHALVSDDLCRVDISGEGSAFIHPSAPRFKLRSDSLAGLGALTQSSGTRLECGAQKAQLWTRNWSPKPLPLIAIFLLNWGEPKSGLLTGSAALRGFLAAACYRGDLIEQMKRSATHVALSVEMLRRVPLWELARPRDLTRAEEIVRFIREDCSMIESWSNWPGHYLRIGSICEVLCSEFEVEQDHCAIDVVDFVLAMKAAGLVEVKDVEVKKDAESA